MPSAGRASDESRHRRFEAAVLPHLDAAYDLARWLTRGDQHAEDIVQTACLRALQFFDGFKGGSSRAWLLAIVRNVFYTWAEKHRAEELAAPFDEELHTPELGAPHPTQPSQPPPPDAELLRRADAELLREAFAALPLPFREAMVLREIEGLSYKEIAAVVGIPIGTVMSRLARARGQLQIYLGAHGRTGGISR